MLKNFSSYFVRTLREDPVDAEVSSHKLLVRGGYIRRVAPGIYTWLPLGLRVLRKVEAVVREEMNRIGGQEVLLPGLLPAEPFKKSHRWEEYGPNLFRLRDRKESDYLLAPTHEEMFTLTVKDMYSSYKDLPVTLYQIQTKYRDESRPRAGLIRGREFIMKDSYSFDIDDAGLEASYMAHREAYQRIFARLDLEYVIVSALSGPMGGSHSEEFLHPCPIGEDTFVRSEGGYVANAEAVITAAPPVVDPQNTPPASVLDTPHAATITQLVDCANKLHPRDDRPWAASDTLKNIVVALTYPTGERELLAIGIPGDREIDMKRLEAAVAPAEVEMANAQDLERYPSIVPGYIGPNVLGPNSPDRVTDADGNISGSIRYVLDPRIVDGTVWITGANETGKHIFGFVKGRDFEADGTIEAAEIREGDPAPDGSGPLKLARGIEIGQIFQLGRKYSKVLGLSVLDEQGKSRVVAMGSYGIGVSRVLGALAESHCDNKGLIWPVGIAPFDVHIIATGRGDEITQAAAAIGSESDMKGLDVIIDDRPKASAGVKFSDAELLGIPITVVVGKALKEGKVEIRERATDRRFEVSLDIAVAEVIKLHERLVQEATPDFLR